MGGTVDGGLNSLWTRVLIIAALLSGAGGGLSSITADTSDRFKGSDFQREIKRRDDEISMLKRDYRELYHRFSTHIETSGVYIHRINEVEKELDEHKEKHE